MSTRRPSAHTPTLLIGWNQCPRRGSPQHVRCTTDRKRDLRFFPVHLKGRESFRGIFGPIGAYIEECAVFCCLARGLRRSPLTLAGIGLLIRVPFPERYALYVFFPPWWLNLDVSRIPLKKKPELEMSCECSLVFRNYAVNRKRLGQILTRKGTAPNIVISFTGMCRLALLVLVFSRTSKASQAKKKKDVALRSLSTVHDRNCAYHCVE